MPFFEIVLLAFALSMDAFAVAIATGIRLCVVTKRQSFRLSFHFGLFQALMPVTGWLLGLSVKEYIESWDHWLAFGLLFFVGSKMLWEAFHADDEENNSCIDPTRGLSLVLLSLATSIDALAVGLSLAVLGETIWGPAVAIGLICAVITFAGMQLGGLASKAKALGTRAEIVGGLVLIGIGLNILHTHGVW